MTVATPMPASRAPRRPDVGIGWRHAHYAELLETQPALDFIEVHSENFFAPGGAALAVLREGRARYPVSLHGVGLSLGSARVHERVTKIFAESQHFAQTQQVAEGDSSGWRLNAWLRSVQALQENPLQGHGVGNWAPVVKRIQGSNADALFGVGNHSNPHQEYLLWAVELGVGGALLLLGLFLCMARDALRFPPPVQRALLGVVAATAVACLFNSALYDDLMGDYFCVSLGLLVALGLRSSSPAFIPPPKTPVPA